jgi:F-type H+-transporting ATPase subunit epsilon
MDKHFTLDIITPARVVFSGSVASLFCPGQEGRFQILHNHAPMLSALTVGRLEFINPEGTRLAFAISGGVAQILTNKVLVLADTAERADEIDVRRAEAAKTRAEERLAGERRDIDAERARAALFRAVNRLKVAHHD